MCVCVVVRVRGANRLWFVIRALEKGGENDRKTEMVVGQVVGCFFGSSRVVGICSRFPLVLVGGDGDVGGCCYRDPLIPALINGVVQMMEVT